MSAARFEYHAIIRWDAGVGEIPLCGVDTSFPHKVSHHVYTTCEACRADPRFNAPRSDAPWPIPETIAESTAQLRRMATMRAQGLIR